jgi:hypothetical protein
MALTGLTTAKRHSPAEGEKGDFHCTGKWICEADHRRKRRTGHSHSGRRLDRVRSKRAHNHQSSHAAVDCRFFLKKSLRGRARYNVVFDICICTAGEVGLEQRATAWISSLERVTL